MLLADATARISWANEALARLLGSSVDELVGRLGLDFCRPEHVYMAREAFASAVAAPGEPVVVTIDLERGGGYVTVDVKAINHLDTPGIEAIVGHVREATSTAGELGESYRALFQNALVGLGVADMQGNLLAFNDAMLEPGGYTRADIERIGNVAKLYADPSDRQRVLQILRARGHVWRENVPFLAKDGSRYETLLTLTPVVFLGRPCLYATVEDVGRG
jgi:PAS domain S-box-containing protein